MHGAATPSFDGGRRAVVMRTGRLLLEPVGDGDLEELFALHSDPLAFADDLTEPLTDREQMRWVLRQWRQNWREHGTGYFTVRSRATGADGSAAGIVGDDGAVMTDAAADGPALLGVVGLTPLEVEGEGESGVEDRSGLEIEGEGGVADDAGLANQHVLSAYWRLAPAATGRGIATEAMAAVLADPRLGARDHEVIAVTAAGNGPSLALAARLGFVRSARAAPGGRSGDVLLVRRPVAAEGT